MNLNAIVIPAATALAMLVAACDEAPQPTGQAASQSTASAEPAPSQADQAPNASTAAQPTADSELSRKVKQALDAKAEGNARARSGHIEVATADGVVTLYGTVDGAPEKERVALLAMGVDGVRSVVNNLVVLRGS